KLRTLEGLFAKRLRDVEACMLEKNACAIAIRFETKANTRILDRSAGRPRELESASCVLARWLAFQHFASHGQPIEIHLGIPRHAKREMVPDARLKIVGKHPHCKRGAIGDRLPHLFARLRNRNLSSNGLGHFRSLFASSD